MPYSQSAPSVSNPSPPAHTGKTWRFNIATRIGIGFLAVFIFGIATLFFSLPFMSDNSDHSGDWIIAVTGLVMIGFGTFMTFALVAIMRTRITLDATMLEATVVDGHNWLLVPHFRSVRLPLTEIRSVESRSEVFRQLGLSTMRDALSIVTSSGERIGLFSNTLGSASTLPFDDVANAIATAVGVPVTDGGTVRTRASGLYGAAASSWTERPLDEAEAKKARRGVKLTIAICTALLLLTFLVRLF